MTLILDFKKSFLNIFWGGIFVLGFRYSQRLIGLWRSYFDVRDMINNATTNGEKPERIELLESELARIESLIDIENMRLYGGEVIHG